MGAIEFLFTWKTKESNECLLCNTGFIIFMNLIIDNKSMTMFSGRHLIESHKIDRENHLLDFQLAWRLLLLLFKQLKMTTRIFTRSQAKTQKPGTLSHIWWNISSCEIIFTWNNIYIQIAFTWQNHLTTCKMKKLHLQIS